MFMTGAILERRLAWLKRKGFEVVSLDEGLRRLANGTAGRNTVVITIDDGFYSVLPVAAPLLKSFGFPATLYMTTYYMTHPNPIFRHAVRYAFWKAAERIPHIGTLLEGSGVSLPATTDHTAGDMWALIRHAETELDEPGRVDLARWLFARLGEDYDELASSRRLSLLSTPEVSRLSEFGIDVQLHTHRHRLTVDDAGREIRDNRAALEKACRSTAQHLCYPSGIWTEALWPLLAKEGVVSATTCDNGLNRQNTPRLALKRFLDGSNVPQVVFEAELSGVLEPVRTLFRRP
jgi:peptidoglycan/xylan/chitin deacetylase (PgdA/CDA1 family)